VNNIVSHNKIVKTYNLSHAQMWMWILCQSPERVISYNIIEHYEIDGGLNISKFWRKYLKAGFQNNVLLVRANSCFYELFNMLKYLGYRSYIFFSKSTK